MAKKWKTDELAYLKRYAKTRTTAELAERYKLEPKAITDQLTEMGLASKDSVAEMRIEHDPLMKVYTQGTRALYGKKWAEAKKLFQQVMAESDHIELRNGAERYLVVCDRNTTKVKGSNDPFLEAVYERNRGNLAEALTLCKAGGRTGKDERFTYLASAIHALQGDLDNAAAMLQSAIAMNPKNRVHACYDGDFAAMRSEPDYAGLFEAAE